MSTALIEEVRAARTEIVSDGYEMSVGELLNLYKDGELSINPAFQRLFRWDETRKTRFIESLLLGIPVPPIFVFQDENGVWELIDGLQRLSTVLQFANVLQNTQGQPQDRLTLAGTAFLPSLGGKMWEPTNADADDGIGQALQLQIKRARMRVEILKKESDPKAKYELFQRLNTGGAALSEQEVRNCVAVMLNKGLYEWLVRCSKNNDFVHTTSQTETAIAAQADVELALRFFAFRSVAYKNGLDVHEYLDQALIKLAGDDAYDIGEETRVFEQTFAMLRGAMGEDAFKRWDGRIFKGKFLLSVYEVLAPGVAHNIAALSSLTTEDRNAFLVSKAKDLWQNEIFRTNSGGGVRGTTRLVNLLPMAAEYLRPD